MLKNFMDLRLLFACVKTLAIAVRFNSITGYARPRETGVIMFGCCLQGACDLVRMIDT